MASDLPRLDGPAGRQWHCPGASHGDVAKHASSPTAPVRGQEIKMEQSGFNAVLLIVMVIFATYIGSYILHL
jgi:hypothetical protein